MLIKKALWLLAHRPGYFYRSVRCYALFVWSRACRAIFFSSRVSLGYNVRLQRNSSVMAEHPRASIVIGSDSIIYEDAQLAAYRDGRLIIGESSIIGDARIFARYQIEIGKHFLSSWNVFIQDYDSHPTISNQRRQQIENMVTSFKPNFRRSSEIKSPPANWNFPGEPIIIGDDVWVGANSTILKGARIGSGSIVASGSVVLKGDYPPNSLIAGNPASVVKDLATENETSRCQMIEIIETHSKSATFVAVNEGVIDRRF